MSNPPTKAREPLNIKPCRAIGLTPDSNALIIRVWALPDRDFDTGPGAIPRDEIAGLLAKWRLPFSTNHLVELAEALNLMRVTIPAAQALSFDPFARLGEAVTILLKDLPELVDLARRPPLNSRPKPELVQAFERLLSAAQEVDRHGVRNIPARRGGAVWHDDAMWLAFLLRIAAAEKNQSDRVILTSATGNAVQFICAALHLACRLNLTGDAVVKAVERYAKGGIPGITSVFE